MSSYLLQVVYRTKPGMKERFLEEIEKKGIDKKVREEDGCLRYEYYYAAQRDDEVFLVEEWESEAHQKKHMEQAHMEELKRIKGEYILETRIEVVEKA